MTERAHSLIFLFPTTGKTMDVCVCQIVHIYKNIIAYLEKSVQNVNRSTGYTNSNHYLPEQEAHYPFP